jgi:hypothetical protein
MHLSLDRVRYCDHVVEVLTEGNSCLQKDNVLRAKKKVG